MFGCAKGTSSKQVADVPVKVEPAQQVMLSPEEMKAAWEKAAAPGEKHKLLSPLAGKWRTKATMWCDPSAKEPEVTKGTSEAKWVLGGRFLQESFQGKANGKPFTGMGLTGYDNVRDAYSSLWVDSMTTGMMTSMGEVTNDGKSFTFLGSYVDPLTKSVKNTRIKIDVVTKDKHLMEYYEKQHDGSEKKMMEIEYLRQ